MNQWLWGSLLLGWLNLSVLTPENRAITLHLPPLPWYVHIHCLPFLAPNQMSCDLQGLSSCQRAGLVFFSERQSCDEQSSLLAHIWLVFRHLVFKRKMMVWCLCWKPVHVSRWRGFGLSLPNPGPLLLPRPPLSACISLSQISRAKLSWVHSTNPHMLKVHACGEEGPGAS